jgi:hypothetical protein
MSPGEIIVANVNEHGFRPAEEAWIKTGRAEPLFAWGTASDPGSEIYAQLITPEGNDVLWSRIPAPKHYLEFNGTHHWDWLPAGTENSCGLTDERGPCDLAMPLAADFACTFFNRYLPPPGTDIAEKIADSLVAPPLHLNKEQEFFAGGHLVGMTRVSDRAGCSVSHNWELSRGGSGSIRFGP